jgi:hypothetical protein
MFLPWGSEQVVRASDLVSDYALLVPLVVAVGLAPRLRVSGEHDKTARLAAWCAGVAAFVTISGWLALPVIQLIEKL